MMKRIALIGCAALMLGAVGCKKEKKAAKPKDEAAAKTTEPATGDMAQKPAEPAKPMTADEKVKWYQDCFAAVSGKDWDKFGKCYSADAESSWVDSGMQPMHGPDEIVNKGAKVMATAIPDWKVQPQVILTNGDKLAAVYLVTGTHTGALAVPGMPEIPPSNKKVGWYAFHIAQMAPDKPEAVKDWNFQDMGTFMGQIGMSKAPHRAPVEKGADQPTVVMAKNDDTEKNNLAAFQKMADAFNKHDVKALSDSLADDAKMVDATAPADMDKKKSMAWHAELFKGVPDVKFAPTDTWAAGDYVVAVGGVTGTNSGPMPSMGIKKPTGKPTQFTGVDVVKFENGKVKEDWFFYNGAALAMQLGLMKPPAGAPPAGGEAGAAPAGGEKKMDDKGADKGADKDAKKMKGGDKKPAEGADQPK